MYKIIPDKVLFDSRLNITDLRIMSFITSFSQDDKKIFASNEWFAAQLNVSKKTVSTSISKLVDLDWVLREIIYKDNSKQIKERILKPSPLAFFTLEEINAVATEKEKDYGKGFIKDFNKMFNT